jgi:hypothetical protein
VSKIVPCRCISVSNQRKLAVTRCQAQRLPQIKCNVIFEGTEIHVRAVHVLRWGREGTTRKVLRARGEM